MLAASVELLKVVFGRSISRRAKLVDAPNAEEIFSYFLISKAGILACTTEMG